MPDGFSLEQALPPSWREAVASAARTPAALALTRFLEAEIEAGKTIYPARERWFAALEAVAPETVKVVILGQDPYHGPGQAHGLSFSVPRGVKFPGSLRNIWKELSRDLGISPPPHGCLESWAAQGVLLLNSVLTVEAGKAASHAGKGWEAVTDALIDAIAKRSDPAVFLLWGSYAQKKGARIDRTRHLVLESVHPSPLSAHRGFIGCGHFSAANAALHAWGKAPITWAIGD